VSERARVICQSIDIFFISLSDKLEKKNKKKKRGENRYEKKEEIHREKKAGT